MPVMPWFMLLFAIAGPEAAAASPTDGTVAPLRFELQAKKPVAAVGGELRIRNVVTNTGDSAVSGCVAPTVEYVIDGSSRSESWFHMVLDAECLDGTEFRIKPGGRFRWNETIRMPDVGEGPATVWTEITVYRRQSDDAREAYRLKSRVPITVVRRAGEQER